MKYSKLIKMFTCLLCLYCQETLAQLQAPQVEKNLEFGGMKLQLTEQARRDIQASVDALYRSEKHFNIMLERVDLYMPLIEPVLKEYGVPDEFKYLVIQESALVPDAVSSSNAVGFWQFKEASALELDMRIDRQVDERMNIVSATKGAAKYLLRSNAEFDNWLYSLQSYMMGQGGASRSVDKRHYGARTMKVSEDTHWYVKKFLSYMIAFEQVVGQQNRNLILYQYTNTAGKTLRHIAQEFDTDEDQLAAYNKWLKGNTIPDDKVYSVVIPLNVGESQDLLAETVKKKKENEAFGHQQKEPGNIPASSPDKLVIVEFNDLKAVVAREGDDFQKLADLGEISENRFRKYNDLAIKDKVIAGQIYYLEKKHRRARMYEHVFQPGENLWQISQQYGIRLDKLLQKNRLSNSKEQVKPGQVLWLRFIRPRYKEIEFREVKAPKGNLYASTKKKIITANPPASKEEKAPLKEEQDLKPEEKTRVPDAQENTKEKNTIEEQPGIKPESPQPEEQKKRMPAQKQDKLLFPAETTPSESELPTQTASPTSTPQKEEIGVVQKDTTKKQTTKSKVPEKKEEKDLLNEGWDLGTGFSPVPEQEKPQQQTPPQKETPARDEFSVDGPVKFVEEKAAKTPNSETKTKQYDLFHQVQQGETLYALSRKYNVTVQELIKWNNLPANPILNVGQQLRISAPEETAPSQAKVQEPTINKEETTAETAAASKSIKYHTVSAGESMYRVARMYNVTIKDIMRWNNKENFDIREGEELIVGKPQN